MEADPARGAAADRRPEVGLSVVSQVETAVTEVRVHGRWSRRLGLDVYVVLRQCLAEHPAALIIDLEDLSDLDAASTAMWLAAGRAASALRPPAFVVLSMPPTRQLASHLRRLGAVRFLPIFATMKQARLAVARRLPDGPRLQLNRLRPGPGSPGVAADAVAVACAAWGLPDLVEPGRRIVTELVTNAVAHAGTDLALTLSLRGDRLHLAVHDGDRRLPCLPEPGSGGHGLRMVDSQAGAWGATPAPDGKVVWAIVQARRPARAAEQPGRDGSDAGG